MVQPPAAAPSAAEPSPAQADSLGFGFWDVVALIVGIVVGTAIFKSPAFVFQNAGGPGWALAAWAAGGALSLCGALCYAELASSIPHNGGDYVYLSRAFGRGAGFLFGWAQVTAVLSASIAAMAHAFGDYAVRAAGRPADEALAWACGAVILVAALNLAGANIGKKAQNLLSLAKIVGLAAIVLAGVVAAWSAQPPVAAPPAINHAEAAPANLGLAMVFVLYAFGGWNDAAFVAAEVRDPRRNLPRALLLGMAAITVIYLAVNWALVAALGWSAASASRAPAADVMQRVVGPSGERLVSCLVAASALGAIHGMLLTGARVNARLGADYRALAWLAAWNPRTRTPVGAILALAAAALLLMASVGTTVGQRFVDATLGGCGIPPIPWDSYFGGFETLVASTAPVFWAFFLLTGLALPVLRLREPTRERPFLTPWYPWPVVVFCAACAYMLYASLAYAGWLTLLGVAPVGVGAVAYALLSRRGATP